MPSRPRRARSRRREAQRRQAKTARRAEHIASASSSYRALTRAEIGDHPLSAISAAVLVTIRKDFYHETPTEFARRANVSPSVVRDAESGARPAWALSRRDFNNIVEAIAVQAEVCLAKLFDQAAVTDYALSRLLAAADAPVADLAVAASLLQDRCGDGSWSLMSWALELPPRERYTATSSQHVLRLPNGPLVTGEDCVRLRSAAAVLAAVDVRAASIGQELLGMLNT